MTSNIGANLIQDSFNDFESKSALEQIEIVENTKESVFNVLKQTVRPEFLNRIDETIMFQPLTLENIKEIVSIQLEKLKERLSKNDIELTITEPAILEIARLGYDPQFGARPVKRVVQRTVLNQLSKDLLANKVSTSDSIELDVINGSLEFTPKKKEVV